MRAIEKKIINLMDASSSAVEVKGSLHLSIRDTINFNGDKILVSLWSNPIFGKELKGSTVYFSFCGWQSNTTKSRINALLSAFSTGGVFQKGGKMYYTSSNQKAIKFDASKIYKVVDGQISEVSEFFEV